MDLPLPCPLEAGWQLVRTIRLPRMLADGRTLGSFSAAVYQPKQDRLWLLSDAPIGHLVPWGTVLSAEENFQSQVLEPVHADGSAVAPTERRLSARTESWGGLAMSTDWRATNTAGWWRWIRPRLVRRR